MIIKLMFSLKYSIYFFAQFLQMSIIQERNDKIVIEIYFYISFFKNTIVLQIIPLCNFPIIPRIIYP